MGTGKRKASPCNDEQPERKRRTSNHPPQRIEHLSILTPVADTHMDDSPVLDQYMNESPVPESPLADDLMDDDVPDLQNPRFRYTPVKDDQFRLLAINPGQGDETISCLLGSFNDCDPCRFEALSYTATSDLADIPTLVNDQIFYVPPNLSRALKALRRSDQKVVLWVDVLCIDNENLEERRIQLGKLGQIYQSARRNLQWLDGPGIYTIL